MKYRYVGTEPYRLGTALIQPGAVCDLSTAPDKNWELIQPVVRRPKPKPPTRVEPTKPTTEKKGEGVNDG